jgi:hypothetical protein
MLACSPRPAVLLVAALMLTLCAGARADTPDPPSGAERVSAGAEHSCAIAADVGLACWGDDTSGQVSEAPEGEFLSVSAGGSHSCAVRAGGDLVCWGKDSSKQVADTPEGEFLSVSAGGAHSCAIRADHGLICWGDDSSGQVSEAPEGEFASVSAGGAHSCALGRYRSLVCWGDDGFGQSSGAEAALRLHKHNNDKHHHHYKDDRPRFLYVSAGARHTCGVTGDGDLVCWGDNSSGQVSGAPAGEFASVSAGGSHSCAVRADGDLACWGEDSSGQVSEAPEGNFLSVSAGGSHSCTAAAGGGSACWGANGEGQVAPLMIGSALPRAVIGASYLHRFETTPQSPAPTYSVISGELPPGLALDGSGELSGEATVAGEFSFTVAAANGVTAEAVREAELSVVGAPLPAAGTATEITTDSALLSASLDPRNLPAEAWFEYWRVDSPASVLTTSVQAVAGGLEPVSLDAQIDGLADDTEYAFRLAAANELDSEPVLGPSASFVTAAEPIVLAPLEEGLPPPVAGQTVNLEPVEGVVETKCQGEGEFESLLDAEQVPVGCLVDTRRGTVALTASQGSSGETQTADFWAGIFRITQRSGDGQPAVLRLAGRRQCEKRTSAKRKRATTSARRRGGRKLWGSGKGNFKTAGNYGSASVRGTTWLVADRCDNSTLFKVGEGTVSVRDFVKRATLVLEAGEQYLAKAPIPRLP